MWGKINVICNEGAWKWNNFCNFSEGFHCIFIDGLHGLMSVNQIKACQKYDLGPVSIQKHTFNYGYFHDTDKAVSRLFYLYNGNSYTVTTTF